MARNEFGKRAPQPTPPPRTTPPAAPPLSAPASSVAESIDAKWKRANDAVVGLTLLDQARWMIDRALETPGSWEADCYIGRACARAFRATGEERAAIVAAIRAAGFKPDRYFEPSVPVNTKKKKRKKKERVTA